MALVIQFTENRRSRLALILAIASWICIFASLTLLVIGIFVKVKVSEYTNLIKDYDGDTVPYVLMAAGGLGALNNLAGGFIAHMVSNPLKRKQFLAPLFMYAISTIAIGFCMLVAGIMCFLHTQHLDDSFHGGLITAMSKYGTELAFKYELDHLQMEYECCGNSGYQNWLKLHWMKGESRTQTPADDVPFSCCSAYSMRPCIHVDVQSNDKHQNYDYEDKTTLHKTGCRDAVMEYFGSVLGYSGGIIIGICIGQVVVALVTRFLQTAMAEAEKNVDDKLGPSIGYLIPPGKPAEPKPVDPVESEVRSAMEAQDLEGHFEGKELNSDESWDGEMDQQIPSGSQISRGSKSRGSHAYMAVPSGPPQSPQPPTSVLQLSGQPPKVPPPYYGP